MRALWSSATPGSLQASTALRTASTAAGRGKLLRQASAMRRLGDGALKGRVTIRGLDDERASAAVDGSTVMPTPEATI